MTKRPWFLAKEKAQRSQFWKQRDSVHQSSNYWLKDSIFERKQSMFEEDESVEKKSKYDHFQLAQYQRAIANFVRILTGRNNIIVTYNTGNKNYTDGKTIALSPNIKQKEFDTAVGLALHEASHIVYTDFLRVRHFLDEVNTEAWEWANAKGHGRLEVDKWIEMRKSLLNVVEDLYIDAMTYRTAPGYRGYYASLYQKFFGDKRIVEGLWSADYAQPTWENYLFHIINIRNPQRNLDALAGLHEMFAEINLPNITRLATIEDRIALATWLFNEIKKHVHEDQIAQSNSNAQGDQGDGEGNEGDNGDGDLNYDQLNEQLEKMADGSDDGGQQPVQSNGTGQATPIDLDKLSDKAREGLKKLYQQQKQFVNGEVRKGKLSARDQAKIDAYASTDMESKTVGANTSFSKKGVPLHIIRDVSPTFIETIGDAYGIGHNWNWMIRDQAKLIREAISRGKVLAKKLQLRNEERVMKSTRLDSGKIDKRLLHEIGFNNFDIFSKINITSYKPSFIHISLDQSGSMGQYGKWENALQFAAQMAVVSKLINNIHLVISTRGTSRDNDTPFMMIVFDSKKHTAKRVEQLFPMLHPTGYTPEGLCFDGIMKETIGMAGNNDAYFINICDGEPYLSYGSDNGRYHYAGEEAQKHCNEQMRRMERGGIKFMTYFIGNHGFEEVQKCYGDRAVHIQAASDIYKIASTMNAKLLAA